jgi:hypothetical protein
MSATATAPFSTLKDHFSPGAPRTFRSQSITSLEGNSDSALKAGSNDALGLDRMGSHSVR